MDSSGAQQDPVVISCEHSNKTSGYIIDEKFHGYLSDYLFQEDICSVELVK
jgi:hypothetical protein